MDILSGVPEDKAQILIRATPSIKLVKNGNKYTMSIITAETTRDITFKSGIEFDEDIQGLLVSIQDRVELDRVSTYLQFYLLKKIALKHFCCTYLGCL